MIDSFARQYAVESDFVTQTFNSLAVVLQVFFVWMQCQSELPIEPRQAFNIFQPLPFIPYQYNSIIRVMDKAISQ
jgi:hypothetical protein